MLQQATSASIQRALLPRTEVAPVQLTTNALEVTALRPIEPQRALRSMNDGEEATEMQPPQYELPLRDVLIKVLQSGEFQQRQERSRRSDNGRLVNFWFQKAFHRDPTPDEATTLAGVMKLFGHKSFFSCLGYSREYEERYGEGLPDLEPVPEPAEA